MQRRTDLYGLSKKLLIAAWWEKISEKNKLGRVPRKPAQDQRNILLTECLSGNFA